MTFSWASAAKARKKGDIAFFPRPIKIGCVLSWQCVCNYFRVLKRIDINKNAAANTTVATSAQFRCNEIVEQIKMYNVRFANPDFDNNIENVHIGFMCC